MKITSVNFIKSAREPSQYPKSLLPEVAFAGRSNVGKSSLINVLVNRKRLAKTSTTPGRTRLVNFFVINNLLYFVDLPGYGYARVPLSVKMDWGPMVERYFRERENLRLVILILDVRRDPSEDDLSLIEWFRFYRICFLVVLTKIDKLSRNQIRIRQQRIKEILGLSPDSYMALFSAKTGEGKGTVWKEIEKFTSTQK
jgi:GTP-binding protein